MNQGPARRLTITAFQLVILVAFLAIWQFLPKVGKLATSTVFLDPFFISSPERIGRTLWHLSRGEQGVLVWPYVWDTVMASLLGVVIGIVAGGAFGLLLSNSPYLSDLFQPFVVAANAVPRIALIPIVVIIFGPTTKASIVIAVMVVFFLAFYNAYEGGKTVPQQVLQNVQILGARRLQTMRRVRLPYAFAWIMASLPLATTFALLTVVAGEILTGSQGIGKLITQALAASNSDLTFALVVILAIVGMAITALSSVLRRVVLHWWDAEHA